MHVPKPVCNFFFDFLTLCEGHADIAVLLMMFASLEKTEIEYAETKDSRGLTAAALAQQANKPELSRALFFRLPVIFTDYFEKLAVAKSV